MGMKIIDDDSRNITSKTVGCFSVKKKMKLVFHNLGMSNLPRRQVIDDACEIKIDYTVCIEHIPDDNENKVPRFKVKSNRNPDWCKEISIYTAEYFDHDKSPSDGFRIALMKFLLSESNIHNYVGLEHLNQKSYTMWDEIRILWSIFNDNLPIPESKSIPYYHIAMYPYDGIIAIEDNKKDE